jgi:hypothetical protein
MYDRLLRLLSEGQTEMFDNDEESLDPIPRRGRKSDKEAPGITSAEVGAGKAHQEVLKKAKAEAEAKKRVERIQAAVAKARRAPNANRP